MITSLFWSAFFLMTMLPIVLYTRKCNQTIRTTLATIWCFSVVIVYTYAGIIFFLLD